MYVVLISMCGSWDECDLVVGWDISVPTYAMIWLIYCESWDECDLVVGLDILVPKCYDLVNLVN
jgi:hypothetical protein